ncbi:transposase [Clostridium cagae]|uniref:transposase n=1 Tax=Clostridium cagae TaxID=2080751 RepID=UPI000CF684A7|nr:transposase [Clostridium cagae]
MGFLKVVVNSPKEDQIIEVKHNQVTLKIRVINLKLDSGITEILITNIFDEGFSVADFKELYFKRWAIEVKYNELKNKLQIENFTGKTQMAVEQDFYATIYLANMVSLAKKYTYITDNLFKKSPLKHRLFLKIYHLVIF